MRFTRSALAWRYANRSPQLGGALLLSLMGLIPIALFLSSASRDLRLVTAGESLQGTVKSMRIVANGPTPLVAAALFARGAGHSRSYQVHYEFRVAGQAFTGVSTVAESDWQRMKLGQLVDVVYLPSDPSVNQLRASLPAHLVPAPMWIGIAAWVVALILVITAIADICGRVQFIDSGVPALGVIDRVDLARGGKGGPHIAALAYSYRTGADAPIRHEEQRQVSLYEPGEVAAGDLVLVVYDPDDPARHEIDRFDARQEDRLRLMAEAGMG